MKMQLDAPMETHGECQIHGELWPTGGARERWRREKRPAPFCLFLIMHQ